MHLISDCPRTRLLTAMLVIFASIASSFLQVVVGQSSVEFVEVSAGLTGVEAGSSDWGDYDGDGDLDLVVTGRDADGNPTARIYENEGGGTFSSISAGLTGVKRGSSSDWGDYDGDGDLDLVVTGRDADGNPTARIYENEGGGTFSPISAGLTGVWGSSSDWGDYDGDSDLDLVVTGRAANDNATARIYENEGGGVFTSVGASLTGVRAGSSNWGDYDGDGDLDLLITGRDGNNDPQATIYENQGGGSFASVGAGLAGVEASSSDWGDYDGDGDLDLVLAGDKDQAVVTTIYQNQGAGSFSALNAGLTGVTNSPTTRWGDIDGDSDLDLVITGGKDNSIGSPTAEIYQNEGGGTFSATDAGLTGVELSSSDWGDFDGDSDLDLVVTGRDSDGNPTARIYENLSSGGDLSDGLVAHYPFNGNANDASGNGHDGTINGDPQFESGSLSQSIALDGDDDYVEISDSDEFDISTFTVSAWVNLSDPPTNECCFYILTHGEDPNTDIRNFDLVVRQGKLVAGSEYQDDDNQFAYSNTIPEQETWYHIVGRRDEEGILKLYVNGEIEDSVSPSGSVDPSVNQSVFIGSNYSHQFDGQDEITNFFPGRIDDVRIYDRALSDSEVQQLYDGDFLAAPTNFSATAGDGQVELTWNPGGGSNPEGYNIYRSTSSFSDISNATKLNSSLISEASYADADVTNGTEYFYRVTAVDSEGNESAPSTEVSATPVALNDQVWATVHGENDTYEVHVVSEEPISDLQSRALSRSTDQDNLRHIYVVDGEGNAVSEETARQLLFEVQSARKTAESGSEVRSALEDFGLRSQDYDELNRNEDDPRSVSYTARVPSATSDLFRHLFIFQPDPKWDFVLPDILIPEIDVQSKRRDLYADVLFDAILQPDIAGDFHGSLTDRLNQLGSAAGLSEQALKTFETIRNGGTVTKGQLQTTLDNFQSVTTNLKAAEYLGKASSALSAASFAADLKSDAAEYYLLQSLATAEAAARLEALERWFASDGTPDPALQNALGDVRDRFENYVGDENNGWLSDLMGAMASAVNAENVIELAKLTSEIQSVLGNLSPALHAAIQPWAINWTIGKEIREQTYAGGRATLAATLWPPLMDRIQTLESNVSGSTIDRDDARELVHLANVTTYLSWHFYDRYLRISNNTITNFGAIAGSVLDLDGDGWDNYDQFISHLQKRRSKSETMHGRTAPPYFFTSRSSLTGNADREFSFLLNLLRDEKPDFSDPPPLVADFSVSKFVGPVPFEVEFTNLSAGEIDSQEWRLGDGSTYKGASPPPKTYGESGTYTIVLTVSNEEGSEDRKRIPVTASAAPTIAEIGGTTISNTLATKNAATTVEFTNASEGTDLSFEWQFGDGTSSTEKNPTHTYEHAGTYTVTLHAYGEGGQDVGTAQDLVQVDGPTGTVTVETNTDESAYGVGGPAFYLGGESTSQTFENVPAGEYTAAFADVGQKDAPPSQTLQVEPDEEESVSATYLTIPSGLSVEASEGQVALSWNTDGADNLAGHDVYRSTSSFSDISNATKLNGSPVSSTSYTDTEVETGTTYYYRVTTVGDDGRESDPSTMASILLRQQQIAASITRSFGDASGPSDYLLVALPGSVDRPLGSTVSGESGVEWQAYWDDGSSQDYFQKYDGSDTFAFRAGRGFWLTSTQEWTFDESLPVVELGSGNATKIPLHDGWNIVSNPLEEDVSWEEIKTANGGVLQPLWTFNGGFSQADTFQTAATGQAYYFLNDEGLDSLIVPFPGTSVANGAALASATGRSEEASSSGRIRLLASVGDSLWSAVRVGVAEEGSEDSDAKNIAAPPVRFSKLSLRLEAPGDAPARQQLLATEYRSPSAGTEGGHTFNLRLQNKTGAPVRLEASGLEAFNGREVALLNRITGRSYDLRDRGSVTVAKADSTALRLAMGSGAYVQDQAEKVVPNKVSLTSYPNPTSGQATLEYTLPEAKEVRLTVYDVLGRQVAVLEQGRKEAGRYRTRLDGSQLSSGVYFGRLRVGNKTRTQKITVVR